MTPENAFSELEKRANPDRAKGAKTYHKVDRLYLGIPNPVLNDLTKEWRRALDTPRKCAVAKGLWETDCYEARVAAAKLLTQARIRPDDQPVWDLIQTWAPDLDCWAIADHAMMAAQRRLLADPARIEDLEPWTISDHLWTKRAALVATLPWTKQRHPTSAEMAIRERVLGWAASYAPDQRWFIQKAIGWWLRDLSKRDPVRVSAFLQIHATDMKAFARKEASKYLD